MLARGVVVTAWPQEGRQCHIHAPLRRKGRSRVRRAGSWGRVMQAVDAQGGGLGTRARHGGGRNPQLVSARAHGPPGFPRNPGFPRKAARDQAPVHHCPHRHHESPGRPRGRPGPGSCRRRPGRVSRTAIPEQPVRGRKWGRWSRRLRRAGVVRFTRLVYVDGVTPYVRDHGFEILRWYAGGARSRRTGGGGPGVRCPR
jgi:hypothetical protein